MIKVKIELGTNSSKFAEGTFYGEIKSFPNYILYDNKYWEWLAFNKLSSEDKNDYVLIFTEYKGEPPNYCQHLDVILASKVVGCECGANFDRHFSSLHLYWCPLWQKEPK